MNRAELVKVLELVKPALATTNMVPIFQCYCFGPDGVSAYNDTIAIIGPTDFGIGGSVGLHGQTFLGLLSSSSSEEVSFSQKGQEITVTLGKSVSKLPFQSGDSFIFETPTDKWKSKIPFTESLAEAIKICLETVSTDATQAALAGITLESDKMYSCNSDALTRIQLKNGITGRRLMSTSFCEAVLKLWGTLEVTKGWLHFSDDWIYAKFDDWSVYGRVMEIGTPIDFEDLLKKHVKNKVQTQAIPNGFAEALSRARVLADPESQKTVATVSKGKLQLLTVTHMGEIKDDLVLKGHLDVVANVNASHLHKAIQYCDQIAFFDNCTILEKTPDILQLVSNMN